MQRRVEGADIFVGLGGRYSGLLQRRRIYVAAPPRQQQARYVVPRLRLHTSLGPIVSSNRTHHALNPHELSLITAGIAMENWIVSMKGRRLYPISTRCWRAGRALFRH